MSLTFALQALLVRHEAYMAEAESERRKLGSSVDVLQSEKKDLEASNAQTIRENRRLLQELESLNSSISTAENEIVTLNTTLQSTLQEIDRLTALTAQAARVEAQLANLEAEHALLQKRYVSRDQSEKTANQRCRRAEITINALQEQIECIEREAIEERERHADVLARFEKRQAVEAELKGKGQKSKDLTGEATGDGNVVSDFVREVLQDNANLQLGIVELREMLMSSNEEVENLREQMALHQPILPTSDPAQPEQSLDRELSNLPANELKPDFHVHHHYHAAPNAPNTIARAAVQKRPKKRRGISASHARKPSSGASAPSFRNAQPTAASAILAQTSVTIPPPSQPNHAHKWSMSQAPSSTTASSLPSSPIFDRLDEYLNSSQPTTPGTSPNASPTFTPRHVKHDSDTSTKGGHNSGRLGHGEPPSISSVLVSARRSSRIEEEDLLVDNADPDIRPEEPEESITNQSPSDASSQQTPEEASTFSLSRPIRPTLHRAASHESMLSTRAMQMPKIRVTPSQHLVSTMRPTIGTTVSSSGPITGGTFATAHRSKPLRRYDSSNHFSKILAAGAVSTSPPSVTSGNVGRSSSASSSGGLLSKRFGGWITGKWGVAPDLTENAFGSGSSKPKTSDKDQGRKASTNIEPIIINEALLQDSLEEKGSFTTQNNLATKATHAHAVHDETPMDTSKYKETQENTSSGHPSSKLNPKNNKITKSNRSSTHVEAVTIDTGLLTESLNDL